MKRFASLATTAALAGSLVGAAHIAQAASTIYLVPIDSLDNGGLGYNPGDTVNFAAVIGLGTSAAGSLSVPTAVVFTQTQFDVADNSYVVKGQGTDPTRGNKKGTFLWGSDAASFTTTASTYQGATLYGEADAVGHVATNVAGKTVAIPAGTYTLATFSFPIAAAITGTSATVFLPTAFGYSNLANNTNGDFQSGVGPLKTLSPKDVNGTTFTESISFPNDATRFSSLTFKVNGASSTVPAPSSLLVVALGAIPAVSALRRRRAAK